MSSYVGYVNEQRVTGFELTKRAAETKLNERIHALLSQGYSEVKAHAVKTSVASFRSFSCEGKEDIELTVVEVQLEN